MENNIRVRAAEIREFNRFYTNIIGLVNQTILDSPYSLAEARVLLEIDKSGRCTAADLTNLLQIDPGYLSRILARFIKEEMVVKTRSATDGRVQVLSLTDKGREIFGKIDETSNRQVIQILDELPGTQTEKLVGHMRGIQHILSHQEDSQVAIRTQKPGDLGYIAYRHGVLYTEEYSLDPVFELYVLESLVKYAKNKQGGEVWVAEADGQIIGFIGLVGIDEDVAQLRWFLIEPEYRGIGLGRRLIACALDYCRQKKYKKVFLWTFQGLDAACHLYKSFGFLPTEQVANTTWKAGTIEERWDLTLGE